MRHFFPLLRHRPTRYDRYMKKQKPWLKLFAVTLSILLLFTARHQTDAETYSGVPISQNTQPGQVAPDQLTVITYNIRGCRDDNGIADPIAVANELKKLDGDIIALQEVDNGLPRSQFVNQAKMIADQMGMYYAYVPAVNFLIGTYGHAVLSRYPILSAKAVALPSGKEPRTMLDAVVQVGGQALHVYETHLGLSQSERASQFSVLKRTVEASNARHEPFVLLGDFNTPTNNRQYKSLLADVQAPFFQLSQPLATLRSTAHPEMIDQIFLSSGIQFHGGFTGDTNRSDHYPVGAILSLPQTKT
ncbi:hypothetical protein EDM56_17615 [Brevibacillus fluminis]|uniref:Endonuclease/exonuclease/phosphatase domain-containing protein n=2 Tax=Brevibacillus fluminis TaxID=511487 RepID=A0A3M8DHH5_9BACL|nr:hypothetical protein EDM56_17615 [Brevibacillus fluminis]